ncbi:MAG: sodium:proton antiporter [Proteobacteria bacterium]|nr:sodium:proton antiporter [Pseudomonadota bacterium]
MAPPAPFELAAVLVGLAAMAGYANHRLLRLPPAVGLTLIGALAALVLVAAGALFPAAGIIRLAEALLAGIDFPTTLMNGMLAFLLFAGALHVDWAAIGRARLAMVLLATAGVLISTALVGLGLAALAPWLGLDLPLPWALVFGALISPTDPVAVLAIVRRAAVPPALQALLAGESLFNDGVGVVVFGILLAMAVAGHGFDPQAALLAFGHEALGGGLFGLAAGWLACRAIRGIDHYPLEVLITLALVMGGYALAGRLGLSAPVAMAAAGLVVGQGLAGATSATTRDYLLKFWELVDELLNAVLFLLIGLEGLALAGQPLLLLACLPLVLLVLAARWASVALPLHLLARRLALGPLAVPALVWGGLRGGIPVALALALPPGPQHDPLLAASLVVVLFSVVIQGGTISTVMERLGRRNQPPRNAAAR